MVSYLDKHRLDDRIALVTGGGRAIGLACSHALAESGARVVIADVDPAVAEAGRSELAGLGFDVETVDLDVTKPDQVTQVATTSTPASAMSTSSSTMPASPAPARRPKRSPTSTG